MGVANSRHDPEAKFIILAQGRSGSTLLSDLLDQSSDVKSDEEIFGAGMPFEVPFPKSYMYNRMRSYHSKVYGCKIKVYDLFRTQGMSTEESIDFLRRRSDEGWKFIHLRRENKLRQAISSLRADQTNIYHQKQNIENQRAKLDLPIKEIPDRIRWFYYFDEIEDRVLEGSEYVKVRYEQDLVNPKNHQAVIDRIANHLEIDTWKAQTDYQKTGPTQLREALTNFDELKNLLEKENLGHFLCMD